MTGTRRRWLWSLPTQVGLAAGAVIESRERGHSAVRFSQSQIDKIFEVELMRPPLTFERLLNSLGAGGLLEGDVRIGDLLVELDQGGRIVFVEDGKRVAVMTSWPAYVDVREERAGIAAALWSAWQSGMFDVAGYDSDVTRIPHRRGTKPDPSPVDEWSDPEGGDGDERVR